MKENTKNFDEVLNKLLDEDISAVQNRSASYFDSWEQKINSHGIILFGCGAFGKRILKGLRKMGIEPLGFSDNNQKIWDNVVEGLTVFSPEDAAYKYPDAVFMVTIWSDVIGHPVTEIETKLHSYKKVEVTSFFYLFWKYPHLFLPYFSIDTPDKTINEAQLIKACFSLFEDDCSKTEFIAQIRWRLQADYNGLTAPVQFTQYFPDDLFTIKDTEVFVDCGAFDGDTLKNFLKKQNSAFGKYFGFEPDPINFGKLKAFSESLPEDIRNKIVVEEYGVSDTEKTISFSSDGSLQSSFSENGNIHVKCISIDERLGDQGVSYIKMDAEGAEPNIIAGAANTIKKHNPIMAVSVYHLYNHLWTLPLAIKKLYGDYSFFLRPHCKASWDLICYAVPKNRINV